MKCEEFIQLIDAFIDGELDDAQTRDMQFHAQNCDKCARELQLAEQLRDMLRGMDDNVVPPLSAQAAWRSAVKAEARSRRMRRLYKICGSVAAAAVIMLGCAAGIHVFNRNSTPDIGAPVAADAGIVYVASDGAEDTSATNARTLRLAEDVSYDMTASLKLMVDDPMAACGSISSLAAEFNGYTDVPNGGDTSAYIVAYIPADSFSQFIDSLNYVGVADDARVTDNGGDSVMVTITLKKN